MIRDRIVPRQVSAFEDLPRTLDRTRERIRTTDIAAAGEASVWDRDIHEVECDLQAILVPVA